MCLQDLQQCLNFPEDLTGGGKSTNTTRTSRRTLPVGQHGCRKLPHSTRKAHWTLNMALILVEFGHFALEKLAVLLLVSSRSS